MKISLLNIKLIVYDFDGVMTNNKVLVDQYGNESVFVNRADGLAIAWLKKKKIPQLILSTEKNPVVSMRAKKLNIPVIQGADNKKRTLIQYIEKKSIKSQNIIYVGNDINDLEVMEYVGIPIATADSHLCIKKIAKYITKASGGEGVIREIMDIIMET